MIHAYATSAAAMAMAIMIRTDMIFEIARVCRSNLVVSLCVFFLMFFHPL